MNYLDKTGLSYLWNKVKTLVGSYLPLSGGTITGNILVSKGSSGQASEPNIKWKTVGTNTPYIGFATDQTDGTFVFGSLKGTTYQTGLAIGGGSGNLLWKGAKVATADDLGAKAPLASPTFTGTPKAPTAAAGTNTTQIATTAFVNTAVSGVKSATSTTATLSSSSWSGSDGNYTQTVNVSGMTATAIVVVSPTPSNAETYAQSGVYCSAQASGTLTFVADTKPSANLSVNIVNLGDA